LVNLRKKCIHYFEIGVHSHLLIKLHYGMWQVGGSTQFECHLRQPYLFSIFWRGHIIY